MTTTFLIVLTVLAMTCILASAFVQIKKPSVDVSPYAAGAGIAIVLLILVFFTSHDPIAPAPEQTQAQNLGVEAPSDPVEEELKKGAKDGTEKLQLRD